SKPNVHNDVNEVGKERIVSNVSTSPMKSGSSLNIIEVLLKNSFDSLNEEDASVWVDETTWVNAKRALNVINVSNDEDVEEMVLEDPNDN
ncbi:hypothetical protein Tco_0933305, partial [Tanacetum coccineum]